MLFQCTPPNILKFVPQLSFQSIRNPWSFIHNNTVAPVPISYIRWSFLHLDSAFLICLPKPEKSWRFTGLQAFSRKIGKARYLQQYRSAEFSECCLFCSRNNQAENLDCLSEDMRFYLENTCSELYCTVW